MKKISMGINYKNKVMIDTEELLNRLWKRAEEGYYNDKPAYQFPKDELNLMYCLGWIDKVNYQIEKQRLEQLEQSIYEYNCLKQRNKVIY